MNKVSAVEGGSQTASLPSPLRLAPGVLFGVLLLGFAWYLWSARGFTVGGYGQSQNEAVLGEIGAGQSVAQTFVAAQDGLEQIDVRLTTPRGSSPGFLTVRLLSLPEGREAWVQTVALSAVENNAYRPFRFEPIADSAGRRYRFELAVEGTSESTALGVWYAPTEYYRDGEAERSGGRVEGDLNFRLFYRYSWGQALADLGRALPEHAGTALWTVLLFLLPGSAALALSRGATDPLARLSLVAGTSVAIVPLVLLWVSLLPFTLDATGARLLVLVLGAVGLAATWRMRSPATVRPAATDSRADVLPLVLGVVVLAFATWSRLAVARDLQVGNWGDSYHHTLISQLIVDRGRVPDSYLPYAPLTSFGYHFGFHALVAFFHWLTGVEVARSVVLVGQLLNVLAVAAAYYFSVTLLGSRWAGVVSGLCVAFLSPMPEFFVNWGRYTQLAGQVALPFAMVLTVRAADRRDWREALLAALLVGGIGVIHFRVLAFYIVFVVAYAAVVLFEGRRAPRQAVGKGPVVAAVGVLALGLCGPWLWSLFRHQQAIAGLWVPPQSVAQGDWLSTYNALDDFRTFLGRELIVLAALGALVGLWRWPRVAIIGGLWVAGLMALANPQRLGLPGQGFVNNFAVQIASYIPAAFLAGAVAAPALDSLRRLPGVRPALALAAVALSLAGAGGGLVILEERYALVRAADLQAMAWVRASTPPEARFLANCFEPPHSGIIVGSDAGWWLPYLAGRDNTVPPNNYNTETWADPDYPREVYDICLALPSAHEAATAARLKALGVGYVYIGAAGGRLRPEDFQNNPLFEERYASGGVYVFGLR